MCIQMCHSVEATLPRGRIKRPYTAYHTGGILGVMPQLTGKAKSYFIFIHLSGMYIAMQFLACMQSLDSISTWVSMLVLHFPC